MMHTPAIVMVAAVLVLVLPAVAAAKQQQPPNVLLPAAAAAAKTHQPPNILFLMCDSMDGRVVDPTSPISQIVKTPFFDSLARDGVNFVRTYAASPQCVPSRTTMVMGRRNDQIRAFSNGNGVAAAPDGTLDSDCVSEYDEQTCGAWAREQRVNASFFDSLQQGPFDGAKRDVRVYGKVDVGAGVIARYGPSVGGDISATGFHSGPSLSILTRSADIRKPTKPNPLNITNDHDDHVHPEDWRQIGRCIDWLHGKKPSDPAWFLYCSLNIPHPPFDSNATWLASVDDALVTVPPIYAGGHGLDPKQEPHPYDSYMSASKAVQGPFTDAQIKKVRKTYYAMCAETDYMLGRVLQAAKDAGVYDNTLVIFLSDHGEMNMEHRQVWKNAHYEASARVPMIVSGGETAGGAWLKRGAVVDNVTSLLDVYPTLMSWAAIGAPRVPSNFDPSRVTTNGRAVELMGTSLMDLLVADGAVAPLPPAPAARPDYVCSQYHSNMGNTGAFMIRQGKWKYQSFGNALPAFKRAKGYVPQLFDLDGDPLEQHNVAPENPRVVAALDALLRADLARGANTIAPSRFNSSSPLQAVDVYVKRQQQGLYRKYFLDAERAEAQWQRLAACVEERRRRGGALDLYADNELESPCVNMDRAEVAAFADDARRHHRGGGSKTLFQLFEKAYRGFNESDWKKVQAWISESP